MACPNPGFMSQLEAHAEGGLFAGIAATPPFAPPPLSPPHAADDARSSCGGGGGGGGGGTTGGDVSGGVAGGTSGAPGALPSVDTTSSFAAVAVGALSGDEAGRLRFYESLELAFVECGVKSAAVASALAAFHGSSNVRTSEGEGVGHSSLAAALAAWRANSSDATTSDAAASDDAAGAGTHAAADQRCLAVACPLSWRGAHRDLTAVRLLAWRLPRTLARAASAAGKRFAEECLPSGTAVVRDQQRARSLDIERKKDTPLHTWRHCTPSRHRSKKFTHVSWCVPRR